MGILCKTFDGNFISQVAHMYKTEWRSLHYLGGQACVLQVRSMSSGRDACGQ